MGSVAVRLHALEFWAGDPDRLGALMTDRLGLHRVPQPPWARSGEADDRVIHLTTGDVRIALRGAGSADDEIARHVAVHGDTLADIVLVGADPAEIGDRARRYGLSVTGSPQRPTVDLFGDRTIRHTTVAPDDTAPTREAGAGPQAVDHVAYCLPYGFADRAASAYQAVFGLDRLDKDSFEQVGPTATGMRSIAMRSSGGFTVVLTEPVSPNGTGQTQQFVDAHAGPGVQHAALAYPDLVAAVESLRVSGVDLLPAPAGYHDQARQRLEDTTIPWDTLRRLGILVDQDEDGLLFQIFTRPITDRDTFFFELIQRGGATGFGANNVRALFAAIEES